ncbi:hypothetical protein BSZ35_18605 [Salinibacter sp. 10B]|nr:hypothetical protein BSZ35_18605 [Salinibacter sp. 10B]
MLLSVMAYAPYASYAQQDNGSNALTVEGKATTAPSPTMDYVETAAELATYGLTERDPMALVTAARILINAGAQESEATREGEAGAPDTGEKTRPDVDFTPEGLLNAAREMAEGNESVTAMVDQTQSMMGQDRGRIPKPGTFSDRVSARSTDRWNLGSFRGGELAEVRVRGDGDTDLDCYVYDHNGNLIDSDTDYTDYCILRWTPRYTGSFRLYVRNLGSIWNGYYGATN